MRPRRKEIAADAKRERNAAKKAAKREKRGRLPDETPHGPIDPWAISYAGKVFA